jgi:thiamine pyrophosphate-dependent acetolactate synthase large subunit-like protein
MALDRFEWLGRLAARVPDDSLVMSTYIGAVSFEWAHHTNEHPRTAHLGQMGDVIGMAVGLALALPHRRVLCLDGDGSVLMELGQLVALGEQRPANLVVFVADNGCYESIGWGEAGRRPTATAGAVDLAAVAAACGVPHTARVETFDQLDAEIDLALGRDVCTFLDVQTEPGHARVQPRRTDGIEDKYRFVRYVEQLEGIWVTGVPPQDIGLMRGQRHS